MVTKQAIETVVGVPTEVRKKYGMHLEPWGTERLILLLAIMNAISVNIAACYTISRPCSVSPSGEY